MVEPVGRLGRRAAEGEASLEDVGRVGDIEEHADVLLDEQDDPAVIGETPDQLGVLADERRG